VIDIRLATAVNTG